MEKSEIIVDIINGSPFLPSSVPYPISDDFTLSAAINARLNGESERARDGKGLIGQPRDCRQIRLGCGRRSAMEDRVSTSMEEIQLTK